MDGLSQKEQRGFLYSASQVSTPLHVSFCVPHCPDLRLNVNEGSLGHCGDTGEENLSPLHDPFKVNGIHLLGLDSQLE